MGSTNALLVMQVLNYSRQYDAIITNITTANSISGTIKPDIDTEMWKIVAGKIDFKDGKQYDIIDTVNTKVQWMMANTDSHQSQGQTGCDPAGPCKRSPKMWIMMGDQIANKSTAAENEAVLENIRFVIRRGRGGCSGLCVVRSAPDREAISGNARRFRPLGDLFDHAHRLRDRLFGSGCLGPVQKHLHSRSKSCTM